MGRHAAPEGRHRRHGALLAQAGLVTVLALVAVSMLLGSGMVRERMVDGRLAGSQTAEQSSSGEDAPTPTVTPSAAISAPRTSDTAPDDPSVTDAPSSDQAKVSESRGADAPSAPTSTESVSDSADTTTPPTATHSDTPTSAPPTAKSFASCAEAKAAGASMIPSTDPRYSPKLDHDGDGVACDRHGDPPTRHVPTPPPTTVTEAPPVLRCVPAGG